MKKKTLITVLALVMVLAIASTGTYAYLSKNAGEVRNTFAVGETGIDDVHLLESEPTYGGNGSYTVDGNRTETEFFYDKLVPGVDVEKDPYMWFDASPSIDVYSFLTVDLTGWTLGADNKTLSSDYLSAAIATGWTYLTTEENVAVFYRTTAAESADISFQVLANDTVEVSGDMPGTATNLPALVFEGYVIQQAAFANATAAWAEAKTAA